MATKLGHKRLLKEFKEMQKSPPPFILARFEEKNILDWHFIIRGPPDSPYHGGEYHGIIMFPSEYPFKPPDIKFYTPSGRFSPNEKICFSMTSFHPSSWNAAWSVATILTGALSFMLGDEITTGSVKTTDEEKKRLAGLSHAFNIQNRKFRDIFPEYAGPIMKDLPDMGQQPSTSSSSSVQPSSSTQPVIDASSGSIQDPADGIKPLATEEINIHSDTPSVQPDSTSPSPFHPISFNSELQTALASQSSSANTLVINQVPKPPRQTWFSRWRWVLAAVAVIILGRISSF